MTPTRIRLPSARTSAWLILGLCAVVLYLRHLSGFDFEKGAIPQDFGAYLKAVRLALEGRSIYDPNDYLTYKYSPGALAPFFLLPSNPIQAWLVAKFFYLSMWVTGLGLSLRISSWRQAGLLALGVILSWKGILETLDYGQTEFIFLFLALLMSWLFPRSPFASGVVAGSIPWFKLPWGLLMLPLALAASRLGARTFRKVILGILAAVILWGLFLPMICFGWHGVALLYWDWSVVLRSQPASLYSDLTNSSLWALAVRLMGDSRLILARVTASVAALGLIAGFSVHQYRRGFRLPPVRWTAQWMLLALLVNPLSWRWASMVTVAVPLSLDWSAWKKAPKTRATMILAVFFIWLLQQNPVARALGWHHWTDINQYGLITFQWLALLILTYAPSQEPQSCAKTFA
jgi:hypothetical protein